MTFFTTEGVPVSDHNRRLLIAALAPLAMFSFSPARALANGAVLYSPTPAAATAATAKGLSGAQVTGLRIRRVSVKGDPRRVATALGKSRRIAWAEPDRAMHILAEPLGDLFGFDIGHEAVLVRLADQISDGGGAHGR